jgi:GNAT superfamily N-acetyltransferase
MNDARTPLTFRAELTPADRDHIRALTAGTGMFYPSEVDVAVELADERLRHGTGSGYAFLFAEQNGTVVGYACYGPISLTAASWDLYWIAVDQHLHGRGIGRELLLRVERAVADAGGDQLFVETAGRDAYTPTRAFYARQGYHVGAELPDFYAPGDSKVIFVKRVAQGARPASSDTVS